MHIHVLFITKLNELLDFAEIIFFKTAPFVLPQNQEERAGQIGLTIVLAGVAGSIIAGIWLDRTKTFK